MKWGIFTISFLILSLHTDSTFWLVVDTIGYVTSLLLF